MIDLKNYKTWVVLVVLLAVGYVSGRYLSPSRVITKTETKIVTQEVVVTKEVDKTDYYKNKVLIETTTTKPDGTVIRQREFVDKSVVIHDDTKDSTDNKNTTTTTNTTTEKDYPQAKYTGSTKVLFAKNVKNIAEDIYGLEVDKKLIGPFVVGAFGLTDKTVGLSLGLNF